MEPQSITFSQEATFHALSHPLRRAVLDLLRTGPMPAGQIARAFTVSRAAVSKHLKQLQLAQLVHATRKGRHRFYQLDVGPLTEAGGWLNSCRTSSDTSHENPKEGENAAIYLTKIN